MTGAPHDLTFSLSYPDEDRARTVERSLSPEVDALGDDRSSATLSREGATVRISLAAADLVALRAASNTWASLATVAGRVSGSA
ncbi:MAG: KEOPS complex subunit Pcc1 [Halobacteriales archaeon]